MEIIEEEKCDEEDKMHKINIAGKDYDRNSNEKVHFVECEKSYEIFKKNTDTLEKYIRYMNKTFKSLESNYVEYVELKDGTRINYIWIMKSPDEKEIKIEKEKIII